MYRYSPTQPWDLFPDLLFFTSKAVAKHNQRCFLHFYFIKNLLKKTSSYVRLVYSKP